MFTCIEDLVLPWQWLLAWYLPFLLPDEGTWLGLAVVDSLLHVELILDLPTLSVLEVNSMLFLFMDPYLEATSVENLRFLSAMVVLETSNNRKKKRVIEMEGAEEHDRACHTCASYVLCVTVEYTGTPGKLERTWEQEQAVYINRWAHRGERLAEAPTLDRDMTYLAAYMESYRRMTRRYITRESAYWEILVESNVTSLLQCEPSSKMYNHLLHILDLVRELSQVALENARVASEASTQATGRGG
ncbi:hypothetical protein SO802_019866 [Lithocarpus litseifolius]|uniref:Uncharacterized protein n=1 Tax=Lithocarpus litseifolius TaxID=425828 RepID=A0AAW2CRZ7_9ROSI